MKNSAIEITGITPVNEYPKLSSHCPNIEICETDQLCLPCQKLNMESILQVFVNISVKSLKMICTPIGNKLVVDAIKHIKLMYVAEDSCQTVHSAHFDVPFCFYILLNELTDEVIDVYTAIEHISVYQLDCRCFVISLIIFACPEIKKKHKYHHYYSKCGYISCKTPIDCDSSHDACMDCTTIKDCTHNNNNSQQVCKINKKHCCMKCGINKHHHCKYYE